jgi:hypothetical protein
MVEGRIWRVLDDSDMGNGISSTIRGKWMALNAFEGSRLYK